MPYTALFLTDRGEWHQAQALAAAPPNLTVIMRRRPTLESLIDILPTLDFIITERTESVPAELIHHAPQLKLIVRLGSLTVGIDTEAARVRGIPVIVQPVLGTIYVAEHILMMILAVIKRLGRSFWLANSATHGLPAHRTDEDTFAFNWLGLTDIGGLHGSRVGILGMGEIGVELARRLSGFGLDSLMYHKRTPFPTEIELMLGSRYTFPDELLTSCNVVISLLPFSAATDQSINAESFAQMPRGSYFVHAGSGSVVDESALLKALESGHLAGAALDTYEYEPLPADHPLVQVARDPHSNLLLTPHTAAASLPPSRAGDYAAILKFLTPI
jgi:phosphoglycerate dehydrogenase-like enzyme